MCAEGFILTNAQFVSRRTDYESTRLEGESGRGRGREKTNYFIHHPNILTTPTTTKPRPHDHTHLQHVDVGPTSTVALVDSDRLFPQQVAGIKEGHLSQLLVGDVAAALRKDITESRKVSVRTYGRVVCTS